MIKLWLGSIRFDFEIGYYKLKMMKLSPKIAKFARFKFKINGFFFRLSSKLTIFHQITKILAKIHRVWQKLTYLVDHAGNNQISALYQFRQIESI